jgi:hypothetical protein
VAIKGKGKTRGRRIVAAPPRPQLVVRKPPIWRRRSVLVSTALILVAAILAGVYINIHSNNNKKLKEHETTAVANLSTQLFAQFPQDRQVIPPDLFSFYPSLGQDLDNLANGQLTAKDAETKAASLLDSASKAAVGIAKIDVNKLIPASFSISGIPTAGGKGITRDELSNALFLIQRSFRLYASVGNIMKAAIAAEGEQRQALVDEGKQTAALAGELFEQGYRNLARLHARLGLQPSTG